MDEIGCYFLEESEFKTLKKAEKWMYIQSLMRIIRELRIQAIKNCLECEKNLMTNKDINIDLYFEDWRACSENCDSCGKEERVNMCETEFNLINHLANSLANLEDKFNALVRVVLNKSLQNNDVLKEFEQELKKSTQGSQDGQSMYQ